MILLIRMWGEKKNPNAPGLSAKRPKIQRILANKTKIPSTDALSLSQPHVKEQRNPPAGKTSRVARLEKKQIGFHTYLLGYNPLLAAESRVG